MPSAVTFNISALFDADYITTVILSLTTTRTNHSLLILQLVVHPNGCFREILTDGSLLPAAAPSAPRSGGDSGDLLVRTNSGFSAEFFQTIGKQDSVLSSQRASEEKSYRNTFK
jgi:hypothetical protein